MKLDISELRSSSVQPNEPRVFFLRRFYLVLFSSFRDVMSDSFPVVTCRAWNDAKSARSKDATAPKEMKRVTR